MIPQARKRAQVREVVQFAATVIERTADARDAVAPSIVSGEEDDFSREYLRGIAAGVRYLQRGGLWCDCASRDASTEDGELA